MTNLIYQGKINRQFWGKLIRQSTVKDMNKCVICVTWGGLSILSNKITFFLGRKE